MDSSRERRLVMASLAFAAGSAIHLIDHLRRGQGSVSDVLYAVGNVSLVVQVVTISLVLTRHRLAPVAAVSAGFSLALGFTAAHWLPRWSSLSDPVWEIHSLTWFSYVASIAEILGALALATTGLVVIRAGSRDRPFVRDQSRVQVENDQSSSPVRVGRS
jgi:hypothetical protein